MEPRSRASPEQFSALVEFMERHGDLLKPQPGVQGRLRSNRLWRELASLLNSIGGGVEKAPDKWKKVWADWKSKTKKKCVAIRRHADGTGGGPSSRQTLTPLEQRVVGIVGMSAVVGQAGIQEQGFNRPSTSNEKMLIDANEFQLDLSVPYANDPLQSPPPATTPPPPPSPLPPPPPPPPTSDTQPSLPPLSQSVSLPPRGPRRLPLGSPRSTATTPRRLQARTRRNRGLTPFDRAVSEFVAVEQRRHQLEERRERNLHERETERLRLESQRIEVSREQNHLLQQLGVIAQTLLETLNRQTQSRLPSTESLPDTN